MNRSSWAWEAGVGGLAALVALFLGLPILVLLVRALLGGTLASAIATPQILDALALSLFTTAASLVLAVVLGTPLAFALARRRFPGASMIEAVIDLPIVLPPSVAGLSLLLVFGRRGLFGDPLGAVGVGIPFTTIAVILAQLFVAAPFYIRSARSGFAAVDRTLEDAARVDGASEPSVFRHVTVPLARAGLTAGIVMTWARALGEFGATIMFAGNIEGRTQTLPLVVYSAFQSSLDASIAAAAILVLAAAGVLIAVRVLGWGRALELRSLA
jgi:molybdate transport system permease protein